MRKTSRWSAVKAMYGDWGIESAELDARLDRSLHPRGPSMLFEEAKRLGIGGNHLVLDIGCGKGRKACELSRRLGCRVVCIDVVSERLKKAKAVVARAKLRRRITLVRGAIEAIPLISGTVDFVWCRDMLNHVLDLQGGIGECARVLKRHGRMLVYNTFATNLLDPQEAKRLYRPLAVVPKNMSPEYFEKISRNAGFRIEERDIIDSEWREYWEESGEHTTSMQLLRIARMRRAGDRLAREIGKVPYSVEMANCLWGVYQMLGKLCPTMYVLRKVGATVNRIR